MNLYLVVWDRTDLTAGCDWTFVVADKRPDEREVITNHYVNEWGDSDFNYDDEIEEAWVEEVNQVNGYQIRVVNHDR